MQPDLPEGYYLDNVKTLFDHVETVYADILEAGYLDFLQNFRQLSSEAQKLLIRLLNRSGELFRQSKLIYTEIRLLDKAARELESRGFIDLVSSLEHNIILSLFNKAEILGLAENAGSLKKLNRAELDEFLLDSADEIFFQGLIDSDKFIRVLHKDMYQLFQMLFFGNLSQSMTDFVLRDLGLYQFENYRIEADNRPYRSAVEIEHHWFLHQLDGFIELTDTTNSDALLECFNAIPDCKDQASPQYRKSDRMRYKIARQLERIDELDTALNLYQQCQLPPSRERQARIYHQQMELQQAIELCGKIIDAPIDESELQFANEFGARIIKRHKLAQISGLSVNSNYQPDIIKFKLDQQSSVEQAVVDYYQEAENPQRCFFLENTLFNGVLGLLIWEAIFAPVAGAFYNPFQYRPSDFYSFDFVKKRQPLFDSIWLSINSNEDIWQRVSACWQAKHSIANPLVNWQYLSLDTIELALQRIDYPHWLAIFERILRDLRNNRSGFPDLILFPGEGGYQLIEVKGPGDTLQKNQQRWMQYFAQHQIPHCLARVSWA